MNKPKFIFKVFLFLLALGFTNSFAQTENRQPQQAEQCYEVVLQIVVASNSAGDSKQSVPASLQNVVKKLKTLYGFSDYRLTTTFLQRTSNSVEYKSLLSDFNQNQDKTAPTFSDWSLRNLRNLSNAQGRGIIQFENFRFGARVPIMVQAFKDDKASSIINYEAIGINIVRFSLNENEPTVIGSLATSKPDELMFLVLTVKPVE